MLNCIYHPTYPMRVVEDEERDKLISTGTWFNNPTDAKNMRAEYERRIRKDQVKRERASKRASKDIRGSAQE